MSVRKGERYRSTEPFEVIAMTAWEAPCTGGEDGILPAGEEFTIRDNPAKGATAIYCDPVRYEELHAHFIPAHERRNRRYRGYYLCVPIADILTKCSRIGPAPDEPSGEPSTKPPERPWERERESVEAGGTIGVLVPILNHGAESYRLLPAEDLGQMEFRLLGALRPGEVLAFRPGDVVRCINKVFSFDEPAELLAVERTTA